MTSPRAALEAEVRRIVDERCALAGQPCEFCEREVAALLALADAAIAAGAEPQPAPDDVRPREGERGWKDVTCGSCGEESGTNFRDEEIDCPECEARRCPHCKRWFGGES